MNQAVVEHIGLYLSECRSCRGSFIHTVQDNRTEDVVANVRTVLVGQCPLCDASFKTRVRSN